MTWSLEGKVARTAADLKHGNHLCPANIAIRDLSLQNADGSAVSKCWFPPGYSAPARGSDGFAFVPEKETIQIRYELDNGAAAIVRAKLELYCRFSDKPLWSLDLVKCGPDWIADGKHVLEWDGRLPKEPASAVAGEKTADGMKHKLTALAPNPVAGVFPDGYVTLEHTPYKLKLTIGRDGQRGEPAVAWTYFHLLIHEIKLVLGPKEAIPSAGKSAVRLALEKDLLDGIAADGGVPVAGQARRLRLVSNLFKQNTGEMDDNTSFSEYESLWGEGPDLPIMVLLHMRDSKGQPVKIEDGPGAKALGLTRILWDWQDEAEGVDGKQSQAQPKAFIKQAIDFYKDNALAFNMKAGKIVTPKGDNCHVERGGKRGKDARPIFPTQPGYAAKDPLEDGKFPFQVDAATERVWASYGRGWTDGKLKGRAGILFRPSRMAGDSYKLKLHIAIETKLVHDATSGADTEKIVVDVTNDPPLPATPQLVLETGIFEVWRELHISRYIRKTSTVPAFLPANLAAVQGPYAEAYIDLRNTMSANDVYEVADHRLSTGVAPDYNALCKAAVAAAGDPVLDLAIDGAANHAASASAFLVRTYPDFSAAVLALHLGNAAAAQNFMVANGVDSEAKYCNSLTSLLSGPCGQVVEQLSILAGHGPGAAAAARDGITILHFDHLHSEMLAAMAGGLLGVKCLNGRAIDVPDATRNRCGFIFWNARVDTFVHEIGHHLFLPHAKYPTAGSPGGFQEERHDDTDANCIMSYNRPRDAFCGLCQLRLRGWDAGPNSAAGSKLKKTGAANKKP